MSVDHYYISPILYTIELPDDNKRVQINSKTIYYKKNN